jgi:hypothetical protein
MAKKKPARPKKGRAKGKQLPHQEPPAVRVDRSCVYHGAWEEEGDFCLGVLSECGTGTEVIRLANLSPEALAEIAAAVHKVQMLPHEEEE